MGILSPLSDRGRDRSAAAVSLDGPKVGGASAEPAARTKAGDADDEDGGEPIDERQAAMMRHAADVESDWGDGDDDDDETGRLPHDPTPSQIRARAEALHSPESRAEAGRWRRRFGKYTDKRLTKRFSRAADWTPPTISEESFQHRGRPFADE